MYNQTIVNVTNICVSYSLNDSSGLVFNFSYTFPNNTNLNSTDYQLGYYEGCRISSIPLSADISLERDVYSIYYWTVKQLNDSWWAHFNSSPGTSQSGYWADWDFYPVDPGHYRCITETNIYQVS